eukprot:CAMPEP_0177607174 /NCGR_PEP_ID=MMETSP0419_2-20121207/17762_1 /TAXON_ID=582737 /ORGANISM="Tetraselmis sp., Strain GSL018" /LENGTH=305 /DNA_ID=CAMNT_0019101709 /DNA_START=300 /DNA_END=1214 /DNA_ORIENTATION=+
MPAGYAVTGTRSSFGNQCLSQKTSSPRCTFGSSTRDKCLKSYLGPEFDRATARSAGGRNSEYGPAYKTYSAFGKCVDSRKLSAEGSKFGTSPRMAWSAKPKSSGPGPGSYKNTSSLGEQYVSHRRSGQKTSFGSASRDKESHVWLSEEHARVSPHSYSTPGPGTYTLKGAIGKQPCTKNEPSWRIGTADRFATTGRRVVEGYPAPCDYNTAVSSVGKQSLSRRKNPAAAAFGKSTRSAWESVYISSEHERASAGKHSPGPTTGIQTSSFSRQSVSPKRTYPSHRFGTAKRNPARGDSTPGPGSYW